MKFSYTILYVDSVSETVEFYERAFGFQRKFLTEENDYGEIATGETTLAFASNELGASNFGRGYERINAAKRPFGVEIAFTTNDIQADFERAVRAGATIYEPLTQKPWGQEVGYLLDNNGFLIEICTEVQT